MEIENNNKNTQIQKEGVHKLLAHSHAMQFVLFIFGFCLDLIFGVKFFTGPAFLWTGLLFLVLGTILIFWAQYTSHHLNRENITKESFSKGPYRYIKNPTNWGIFFMIVGFGVITNSFFVILFGIISSLIAKFVFLNKEEKILTAKYGDPYLEYRKSVRF
ncbi:MAG: isoprenylcysteine carboxylmethyltransferase family protein [Candidatus Pacebacteria bacterium]|nr:isoprenylcysteine carboxylmethyltransferase family protein [Candidatus Paceibacterota bacterium]